MMLNLFEFNDYKSYLNEKISYEASLDRGFRTRLCEHVQCQPSYLSQVLNGKPEFTLEQAHRLNQFFFHDSLETRFFLLLVERSRAGTKELKQFFSEQILEIKKTRSSLKQRLKKTEDISKEDQDKYYSTWFYSAIYVIISIPEFQSIPYIAGRFNLPEELVREVISFLEDSGLIQKKDGIYHVTKKRLHLDRDSIFIQRHHINWRSQSLQSVEKNLSSDLHFSTVVSLSVEDYEKVKEVFIKAISSAREIIGPSKEEEIVAITLDAFKL
jgi:uncharacterized protein (TIGR02147 family)